MKQLGLGLERDAQISAASTTVAHGEDKGQPPRKVEHPFRVLKRQFGFKKVLYRGLTKNSAQVVTCSHC